MNGENARTHGHASTFPESRCASASAGLTGLASTQADATSTTVTRHAVSTCAVLRRSRRYTVPCASGAPPSSAPEMYQARKIPSCQPNTLVNASVNVPTPYTRTPIDQTSRCGPRPLVR